MNEAITKNGAIQTLISETERFFVQVDGHCMMPLISSGDRLQVCRKSTCYPGDIVVVDMSPDRWVCHRLLGFARYRGTRWVLTKPDHGQRRDRLMPAERLLGKVVRVNASAPTVARRDRLRAMAWWARCMSGLAWKWLLRHTLPRFARSSA